MRYRGRTVLVALVAALALGALASASASAQKMVPVFTPNTGFPIKIENSLHEGAVTLAGQSILEISCGRSRTTGEITAARSVALTLEWAGCRIGGTAVKSEGSSAETVVISGRGSLFYIDKAEKRVGIVFTLKKVNLEYGASGKAALEGSIVIPVEPVNTEIKSGSSTLLLPIHAGKVVGEPEVHSYENESGEAESTTLREVHELQSGTGAIEVKGENTVAPNKTLTVTEESPFYGEFGSEGSGDGQFSYPEDVAFASNGDVYVTDRGNNRVQELTATGGFIRAWGFGVGKAGKNELEVCASECKAGIAGSGNGQFSYPLGIAVNQTTGNVYVVDGENLRVEEFSATGGFIRTWGGEGTGKGKFGKKSIYGWEGADGIAVAPNGTVYVADTANRSVQEFKEEGKFVLEWDYTFNGLGGIAVAPNGNVYTSEESSATHVQEFSTTGGVATFITEWGPAEAGSEGIAVAANGSVYAVDRASGASVQAFSSSGELFGQWGSEGSGIEQFNRPEGVAVDPLNGDVYVAVSGSFESGSRLEYFQPSI